MVVFGRKWLFSGKSFCIRAKIVVFGQKLLYSRICAKVNPFGQKWLYSGQSGSIRAEVVIIG